VLHDYSLALDDYPDLLTRMRRKGEDVPDHGHADLQSFPETLTRALRFADSAPEADWNLDQRDAMCQGDEKHVRRKVITADTEIREDALECIAADGPISTPDISKAGRPEMAAVPESEAQEHGDCHVSPSKEVIHLGILRDETLDHAVADDHFAVVDVGQELWEILR
jgi:hypothetical protein